MSNVIATLAIWYSLYRLYRWVYPPVKAVPSATLCEIKVHALGPEFVATVSKGSKKWIIQSPNMKRLIRAAAGRVMAE